MPQEYTASDRVISARVGDDFVVERAVPETDEELDSPEG